jgi:hypothetical protein
VPFLTDPDCLQAVADLLKADVPSLPSYWPGVVAAAHVSAFQEIQGRLIARGYTPAQVLQWDRGPELEKSLTIFWALTNGGGLSGYDDKFIRMYDRRKELDTVVVALNGVWTRPGDTPGQVSTGAFDTSGDLFSGYADPSDPRIGDPRGMRF